MPSGENKATPEPPSKAEKNKKSRAIKAEIARLKQSCKDLPEDTLNIAEGLIEEAAYMRVTLTELKKSLDNTGWTELFSQSEKTAPYEKKRAKAEIYLNMNPNYQRIMKQLTDLLPKGEFNAEDTDELGGFVSGRED